MKKIHIYFTFFIFIASNIYSQERVDFKVEYKPSYTYTQLTEQNSSQEITYLGSDEVLEKLKSKGIENPTVTNTLTLLKNINKTGKLKNNEFSLKIEFKDTGEKKVKNIIPFGTVIYGKVKIGEKPTLDSVNSPKMDIEYKKVFLSTMQSVLSQITLPNKEIKIGETFTREMPLTFPIGSESLKMTNTITYKLIRIENNKAYFDIIQNYTINITDKKDDINANGIGDGVLIFDMTNNFYLKYELNSDINMEINKGSFTAKVKSKNKFVQNTTISKN